MNAHAHLLTKSTNKHKRSAQPQRECPHKVDELHSVSNRKHLQSQFPLDRRGVHQPAKAPARCPRVARVTLGLLPCHCLAQKKAHCHHPGVGSGDARLRMTNWLEGVSDESRPRNILWTEKCILSFDKHGTLYGQVQKPDSHHADWSRSQRHLHEARLSHQDNAKVFILESHPKYDWIRELYSVQSLVSWPQFVLKLPRLYKGPKEHLLCCIFSSFRCFQLFFVLAHF